MIDQSAILLINIWVLCSMGRSSTTNTKKKILVAIYVIRAEQHSRDDLKIDIAPISHHGIKARIRNITILTI